MADYRLTESARVDADEIYLHSIVKFDLPTARTYMSGMHERFELLADNPSFGRDYSHILPGLRRYEHRSHSIYYREEKNGILVIRILGSSQDPALHIVESDAT